MNFRAIYTDEVLAELSVSRPKIPISARAALQRINRRLAKDHQRVRKSRGRMLNQPECGEYHEIDSYRNALLDWDVDLEARGRELGVIADWETVEGYGEVADTVAAVLS